MASKVAVVREALYDAVNAVAGVRGYRYEVDAPASPGALVRFPSSVERMDLRGGWRYEVPVVVFVSRASDRSADANLEALVDDIVDAIEADPNLDATIDSAVFIGADGYEILNIGDVPHLAVTLRFEVMA